MEVHFNGVWVNGKRCGKGKYYSKDGSRQTGKYVDDKKDGAFKYYTKDGKKTIRMYKNGIRVND